MLVTILKPLNILLALAVCWGASHAKGAPDVAVDRFVAVASDCVHKEYPKPHFAQFAQRRRRAAA